MRKQKEERLEDRVGVAGAEVEEPEGEGEEEAEEELVPGVEGLWR